MEINMLGTDSGGGMITGTWQNPDTGEIVHVRDSYIDGDDMVIVLTNERTYTMDQFSKFIQIDATAEDLINLEKDKKEADRRNLLFDGMGTPPAPKNKGLAAMLGDETLINNTPVSDNSVQEDSPIISSNKITTSTSSQMKKSDYGKNVNMVLEVLEKSSAPEINVSIKWPDFPGDAIDTLKKYFGVTDKDVVDAVIEKYCNIDELKDAIELWFGKADS